MNLWNYLNNYHQTGVIPFHMPAHKRNTAFIEYLQKFGADIDFTEIQATDDLHHADGILKECMQKAETLWNTQHSFFMVNGSTGGILSGIRACTHYGDKILVARNCHKSVYNAIELFGLQPVYILPEYIESYHIYGSVSPEKTERILQENPDIKLIVITSPTYEGIISDIQHLSEIAHRFHIPLMVDEAHGSHLDLSPYFTGGAIRGGADIVVQSLHKTLPSLTQSAIIHFNSEIVCAKSLQRQLAVFQTSSPSYLLMASIDSCIELVKDTSLFQAWHENLMMFKEKTKALQNFRIFGYTDTIPKNSVFGFDYGKILISCTDTVFTGNRLADILHKQYHMDFEMSNTETLLAMTSMADTKENLFYLAECLLNIDKQDIQGNRPLYQTIVRTVPESHFIPSVALSEPYKMITLEKSIGKVSAEYIWIYPPGIPVITIGEVINEEIVQIIQTAIRQNLNLQKTISENPYEIATLDI